MQADPLPNSAGAAGRFDVSGPLGSTWLLGTVLCLALTEAGGAVSSREGNGPGAGCSTLGCDVSALAGFCVTSVGVEPTVDAPGEDCIMVGLG